MSAVDGQTFLRQMRRLVLGRDTTSTEQELLGRFLSTREEAAFEQLMLRHGPMVWSVCRAVLKQQQDAEDAFQATFLILARKAQSVRRSAGLAAWLHRVALSAALTARKAGQRRMIREVKSAKPQ